MQNYRVYFVGEDGRFNGVQEIECEGDQAAVDKATDIAGGREVQVWDRGRCVMILNERDPLRT
ncbi:MAG TPA: hypothetical protein VGG01_14825 [Xanthobacteraceae bacterium]|jgi:hypothetical protein